MDLSINKKSLLFLLGSLGVAIGVTNSLRIEALSILALLMGVYFIIKGIE